MSKLSTWSEWVGARVRTARKARGWSVKELAARCAEVGAPELTAVVLYVIEGPRPRSVTGDEWLALAEALEVPPLTLMLPPEDIEYSITSACSARASAVAKWIAGMGVLDPDEVVRQQRYVAEWTKSLPYLPRLGGVRDIETVKTDVHKLVGRPVEQWGASEIKTFVGGLRTLDDEVWREIERLMVLLLAGHQPEGGAGNGEH